MRIQTKLLMLTAFWGLALAVNLTALGYLARTIPAALQRAERMSISQQRAALQMRAELRDAEAALYRYLMEGEPGFVTQFEHHLQRFESHLRDYEGLAHSDIELAWVEQLWQNYGAAQEVGRSLIALRDQQSADLQKLESARYTANLLLAGPMPASRVHDTSYQKAVSDMQTNLQAMLLAVTAYLNSPQMEERTRFSEAAIRYYQAEQRYKLLATTAQEKDWDRTLNESFAHIQGIALRLINERDKQLAEFANFAAILFHMGQELLVENIQPATEQNLNQTWADLLETVRFIMLTSLLTSALVFIVAVVLTTPLIREMNTGIRALLAGADRVTAGKLAEPVPLPGGFELRRLARTFNSMMQELSSRERRLKQRLSELEALRQVSLQLTSTLDPEVVFETIAEAALRLVSAEEVHIFMSEAQPLNLRFVASAWQQKPYPPSPRPPRADGLVMQVARSGELVLVNHAQSHPLFASAQAQTWDIHAAAGLPLTVGQKVVGVLHVVVRDRETFSDDDLRILDLLADQAAVAIENTRLYGEVAEREAHLQTVLQKLAHVQEEERRLVGLDLHDGLIQLLISANMHLNTLESMTEGLSSQARAELAVGHARLQAAIDEARRVIAELRPAALEELGLVDGLRQYAATMSQHENWQLEFITDLPEGLEIPVDLEIALFRIAQEALANARKHASTRQIRLELQLEGSDLVLQVQDWGQGFTVGALPAEDARLGLLGMQERAAMFDGAFNLETGPGAGVHITVRIPLHNELCRKVN